MKKLIVIILLVFIVYPNLSQAALLKNTYPRLASYFLKWEINEFEARQLARYDLLILDMEVQENNPESIKLIRQLNPDVIILAYITSQEIIDDVYSVAGRTGAFLRSELRENIHSGWWLKDQNGNRVSNWSDTYMINVSDYASLNNNGQRFNDYFPEFVFNKIISSGLWDGVFYDNTWGDVYWVNGGNLDVNNDGRRDSIDEANRLWVTGFKKILDKTRSLLGNDYIIAGNGRTFEGYQKVINGMMLESFPSAWENGGTWSGSMTSYLKYTPMNRYPQVPIINVGSKNEFDYKNLRFGLTSALLGDGFYSFDYGTTNHSQTWWYDEYETNLGPAKSNPYNLLDLNNSALKPSLWRRDFKFGSIIVNSTDKDQLHIFKKEEFEKIKGTQDKNVNNGAKINFLKLASRDGVVLLKKNNHVIDSPFVNGYFYRSFNMRGQQTRNGFYSFVSSFPAGEQIILSNAKNGIDEYSLVAKNGEISTNKNGKRIKSLLPYGKNFSEHLNISADVSEGDFRLIATGPSLGGGPQVMIISPDGKIKNSFFAYDKKSRGGVNVALADVDGDKNLEIITGPGKGDEPLIKIFTLAGKLKSSFLAYDKNFKGGVEISAGDLNNDGLSEIVTGPGQGGGPHVKIFSHTGKMLSQFFAYDKKYHEGVEISLSDMDSNGEVEILIGVKNFY